MVKCIRYYYLNVILLVILNVILKYLFKCNSHFSDYFYCSHTNFNLYLVL